MSCRLAGTVSHRHLLARYFSIARTSFQEQIAFRYQFLALIPNNILRLFLLYFIWRAAYGGREVIASFDFPQIITYSILSQIIMAFTAVEVELSVGQSIVRGEIGSKLLLPLSYHGLVFSQALAEMVLQAALRAVVYLALGFAFLGLLPPAQPLMLVWMGISVLLAMISIFCFSFAWGLLFIFVYATWGLPCIKSFLLQFLSGALIPFAFFPDWLQRVASALPFAGMSSIPVSIYLGRLPLEQIPGALFMQLLWVVVLWVAMAFFSRKAFRKIDLVGG